MGSGNSSDKEFLICFIENEVMLFKLLAFLFCQLDIISSFCNRVYRHFNWYKILYIKFLCFSFSTLPDAFL